MTEENEARSDAHEVGAPDLLRSAARLIERALIKLDMTFDECDGCGRRHFRNTEHARIYEQLTDTPDKLTRAGNLLDKHPAAIAARQDRRAVDEQIRRSKV